VLGGLITIPSCVADRIGEQVKPESEYAATVRIPPDRRTVLYDGSSYYNSAVTEITIDR
jgi:hypothetical protein